MMVTKTKRVLVSWAMGFLGSHLINKLVQRGINNITMPRSKEHDLRQKAVCANVVRDQQTIVYLATNARGIGYNHKYPATLFYNNLLIGTYLINEARRTGAEKFIAIDTTCSYARYIPLPFKEESLWSNYPKETNASYGLAKFMQFVQAQAYRQQYRLNTIYLLPVNLYGPGDNFNPQSSHITPALIRRFSETAKKQPRRGHCLGHRKAVSLSGIDTCR